jgi:hypothetical protein
MLLPHVNPPQTPVKPPSLHFLNWVVEIRLREGLSDRNLVQNDRQQCIKDIEATMVDNLGVK